MFLFHSFIDRVRVCIVYANKLIGCIQYHVEALLYAFMSDLMCVEPMIEGVTVQKKDFIILERKELKEKAWNGSVWASCEHICKVKILTNPSPLSGSREIGCSFLLFLCVIGKWCFTSTLSCGCFLKQKNFYLLRFNQMWQQQEETGPLSNWVLVDGIHYFDLFESFQFFLFLKSNFYWILNTN